MDRGIMISLEGIDGCGKTTQAYLLQERLKVEDLPYIMVREPGGTAVGERIRELLLQKDSILSLETELLLYAAARTEVVQQVILPGLEKGYIVVCDRYTDSTAAYQGFGAGLDLKWINALNERATKGLQPHLTFLFDLPVETAIQRRGTGGDRIEERSLSFHQQVREGYLTLAGENRGRIRVVDAACPPEKQHSYIWEQCIPLLQGIKGENK